jgi:hypothetical protein
MKGYVARKGNQHYAVIYEGLDPVSGRERRRWHPAGPDRAEAEALCWRSTKVAFCDQRDSRWWGRGSSRRPTLAAACRGGVGGRRRECLVLA